MIGAVDFVKLLTVTSVIESATGIGKCDNFTTKCDRYFKVQQNLPHHWRLN